MNKKISCLLWIVLTVSITQAQTKYAVEGTVNDTSLNPVQDGLVLLFNAADSSLVQNVFIETGVFRFDPVDSGTYLLRTNCLEFTDQTIVLKVPLRTPVSLVLSRHPKALKEVQVSGYRKSFDFKNGNILTLVENSILASLPDVFEVLSKLPTVQVSNDRENINIIGRGTPLLYLDNQRVTLNELSALSVNDIKSIEVINNPPSKYEADGRAVILIKRKFNPSNGYKVDISEIASQKRFFENRVSVNSSLKRNKFELRLNAQYNYLNRWEGIEGNIKTDTGYYQSSYNGTSIGPRQQYILSTGLFYQLNSTDYISINISGRLQNESFTTSTTSKEAKKYTETSVENKGYGVSKRPYLNTTLNYLKDFKDKGTQLFVGGQLANYERNLKNEILNNTNYTAFIPTENRLQRSEIRLGVARLDIDKKIKTDHIWSSGILYTQANAGTQFELELVPMATQIATKYEYNENNKAGYTQLSGRIKRYEYQLGIRVETTNLKGGFADSTSLLINRSFTNAFPKAGITFPIDSSSSLSFNYAKSIRRPDYANANQVTNYITPFLEYSNNVNINPCITDELTVNYTYHKISLQVNLYTRTNPTYHITQYDTLFNKLRIINVNLQSEQGGIATLNLPFEYKNFSSTNIASVIYNRITDPRAYFNQASPYYYFYSNNQLKLPKGFTLMATGWIQTIRKEGIYERNRQFAVDLSVSKTIRKKLTITLNALDIFRSLNYIEKYTVNGISAQNTYYENVKEYSISIRYSFGKIQKQQFKNRDVNEGSRIN